MSAEAEPCFVQVGANRVYVESWGDDRLPVLLCVHGLGGGTHLFGALGPALAGQCRTAALDLPGSGLSPPSGGPFSFDAAADLVAGFARSGHARGIPLCLLGHSMGAIVALEVTRLDPDLASGLVITGGLPGPLPAVRARLRQRVAEIREHGIGRLGPEAVEANFSRRSRQERPELTACWAKLFARQDADAYADTADALAAWTARTLPPLERIPCLVVTGEEDRYAPPQAIRDFARALPAGTRVEVMQDCGHLPFLEHPSAFATIVGSFLHDRCGWGR